MKVKLGNILEKCLVYLIILGEDENIYKIILVDKVF